MWSCVEPSGTLEDPLEHTLEKPREIQGILEYSRAVRDILPPNLATSSLPFCPRTREFAP